LVSGMRRRPSQSSFLLLSEFKNADEYGYNPEANEDRYGIKAREDRHDLELDG